MQRLKQFCQSISLKQLLIAALAGIVLLSSSACGTLRAAAPPNSNTQYNPNTPGQAMYPHKDTERDTTAADAKADRAIRKAAKNRREVPNPRDYVEEVTPDKSLGRQAKELGDSAQQAAENVRKSTQRAAKNAAENTQDAVDRAANAVDRATNPG